jgi:hypothetical protein
MAKKKRIQRLPAPTTAARVETGPVQFGDDWPVCSFVATKCIALAGSIRRLCENIGKDDLAILPVGSLGPLAELVETIERSVIVSRR